MQREKLVESYSQHLHSHPSQTITDMRLLSARGLELAGAVLGARIEKSSESWGEETSGDIRRHGDNTGAQRGSGLASDQNNVRLSCVLTTSEARL